MDKMSEEDKKSFMAMDADKRKVKMQKNAEEVSKRDEEMAKRDQKIAELEKRLELDDLRKRAEDVLPNVTGDIAVRAQLLKAAEGIGDDAVAILKAANDISAEATKANGSSEQANVEKSGSANEKLEALAKAHAKEKGVNYYDAYEAVSETNRELYAEAIKGE